MGINKFSQELKTKVSQSRLFKALTTHSPEVFPKFTHLIKSVEVVQSNTISPGCIIKTTLPDGAPFKFMSHRIDAIDEANHVCKYVLVDGDVLGDKLEKICYELKVEASEDGGSVMKLDMDFYTKGDFEITNEEFELRAKDALGLYKACEEYLIAHPHACA